MFSRVNCSRLESFISHICLAKPWNGGIVVGLKDGMFRFPLLLKVFKAGFGGMLCRGSVLRDHKNAGDAFSASFTFFLLWRQHRARTHTREGAFKCCYFSYH